jgi:tRNA1Val (adenine37-N6)-methyltransferase
MLKSEIKPFQFKQFSIAQDRCPMRVGTDGVLLGAWADVNKVKNILDIGTGTGLIAIMLGQRTETAQVVAVEIDEAACQQAIENCQNVAWGNRVQAIPISIQDYAKAAKETFDLIVSNPPFFTGGTFSDNQDRASVRHAVKLPHGDLLGAVRTLLAQKGKFCVILPYIEGLRFVEMASTYHLYCTKSTKIYPKAGKPVERLLLQFEKEAKNMTEDSLIIQKEERNEWTEAYIQLTKDFYLNM